MNTCRQIALGAAAWICAGPALAVQPAALRIPTERVANVFFARARVNGVSPLWFTLDTGANLTVLDSTTARSLGLRVIDEGLHPGVGIGSGLTRLGRTQGVSVDVGQVASFGPPSLFVVPVRSMSRSLGHQVDGVLGVDFMRRHVVEFNYATGAIVFHDPSRFVYDGRGHILPIELHDDVLTVRATLTLPDGQRLTAQLLVDTGRTGRPILNGPFVLRHRLVDRFANRHEMAMSQGVNGFTRAWMVTIPEMRFGTLSVDHPEVDLSDATTGLSATGAHDGHLGAKLLSRFRVFIDFPGRRLILEPKS